MVTETLTEPTRTPQTTGGLISIVTYTTFTKLFRCQETHSSFKVNKCIYNPASGNFANFPTHFDKAVIYLSVARAI